MNFKDAYLEDLEDVFFDLEEFASEHMVDGKSMTVILTYETLENAESSLNPKERARNKDNITLFIQEKDASRKFTAGSMINLDGRKLFVQDVKHYEGIYKLTVGTYRI